MGDFFEIPPEELEKLEAQRKRFTFIPPDQIFCPKECGFWVPGDGIFEKIPRESLHRLVEHHKAGCSELAEKPADSMQDRFSAFLHQVTNRTQDDMGV